MQNTGLGRMADTRRYFFGPTVETRRRFSHLLHLPLFHHVVVDNLAIEMEVTSMWARVRVLLPPMQQTESSGKTKTGIKLKQTTHKRAGKATGMPWTPCRPGSQNQNKELIGQATTELRPSHPLAEFLGWNQAFLSPPPPQKESQTWKKSQLKSAFYIG